MNKKETKFIAILSILLLLGCGIFYGIQYKKMKQIENDTIYIFITYENSIVDVLDPTVDGVYTYDGNYGKVNIEVRDGRYRFFDVDCPNHTCEEMGWRDALKSSEDQSFLDVIVNQLIQCQPNGFTVMHGTRKQYQGMME